MPHHAKSAPALTTLAVLGLAAILPQAAPAQNLVADPSFEKSTTDTYYTTGQTVGGDSPWTVSQGIVRPLPYTFQANSGSSDVMLVNGGVQQSVLTQAGQSYTLTFWAFANTSRVLNATFAGSTVFSQTITGPLGVNASGHYTQYSAQVQGNGVSSPLEFDANANGYTVILDDVSLRPNAPAATPAPEPSSVAAFGCVGLGVAGLILKAKKRRAA